MKRTGFVNSRRGAAAVLAMLFLVLATTLTVAMFTLASTNVQSANNLADVNRAQAAAETGLRWMQYRFVHMARPKTTKGTIDAATADAIWAGASGLQQAIVDDISNPAKSANAMSVVAERPCTTTATSIKTSLISTETNGGKFQITIAQKASDHTCLIVTSTGTYDNASRTVSMEFKIDKKIKFAVVGKVPIQLGRNTIVEGNVAVATTTKYPPIQMLSDFYRTDFDTALATKIQNFESFMKTNHVGYDGRININNTAEKTAAVAQGYSDYNSDGYIDEYDIVVKQYDTNNDKKISKAEFTNPANGQLYDANLFSVIDQLNGPMYSGDPTRDGYNDNYIDNRDGYAKVRGTVSLAMTTTAWQTQLGTGGSINDYMQGPVTPTEAGATPVKFGADVSSDMIDLNPANFEQATQNYKALTGSAAGSTTTGFGAQVKITNKTLSVSDASVMKVTSAGSTPFHVGDYVLTSQFNSVNSALPAAQRAVGTDQTVAPVTEHTPYGSTTYQATYKRPVFKNMVFTNVQIPKGMNALFQNCTFQGVTWVETEHDIMSGASVTTDPNNGKTWAQAKVSGSGSFSKDSVLISSGTPTTGQMITSGSQNGNNLRFDSCEFDGPIAGTDATAYTHFANSWEFTGSTMFDNQIDQTATIISPNVNIEMGSFTDPSHSPSTLIGVVVAGNLDIRGTSNVDGAIIITGDGAGNTTLGYFGPDDAQSTPSAMPEGGFGKLNIRYNPYRALPDGINIAIDITPTTSTYSEGATCVN
ncbi:MAG TPA: pilus assembly PilX N-terminal domain-containing protein [Tepidisphaeraceae bacterium]|nr:pilus assembly PilX N-terminal domain-containing protein [Tepidisphaeraceae bacterium]